MTPGRSTLKFLLTSFNYMLLDPAVVTCKSDKITVEVPDDLVTSYSTVLGNVSLYISGDINQPWSKNCKGKNEIMKSNRTASS